MSKLSQSDFGTLLELANRIDAEQRQDLEEFLKSSPSTRNLIIKLATKSKIVRNIKDNQIVEKTEQIQTDGKRKKTGGRVAKPLEIIAPKGCGLNTGIKYSLDRFEKFLKDAGFKSAKTYSQGMGTLLKNRGLHSTTELTIIGLKGVRDDVAGPGKRDQNKRLYLKKFNKYLIWEFENRHN